MTGELTQHYINQGLTHHHTKIISRNITGGLSFAGNVFIIQDIIRHRNEIAQNGVYGRLMIGLAGTDILTSICSSLAAWPMPKGYFIMAVGSTGTCDATGFFTQIGLIGTPLYNCSLVVNYLLRLRYLWGERKVEKVEKWLHIVPLSFSIASAFLGLIFNVYGPIGVNCWITNGYPIRCLDDGNDVECIRGGNVFLFNSFFSFYILIPIFAVLFVAITMFITFRSILIIERASDRFSFASFRLASERQYRNRTMSRRIFLQGILYSAVLILVSGFIIANFVHFKVARKLNGVLQFITGILTPLRGCFNTLIYLIPDIEKMIEERKRRKRSRVLEVIVASSNDINTPTPTPTFTKTRRRVSFADYSDVEIDAVDMDADNHNGDTNDDKESTEKDSKSSDGESFGFVKKIRNCNDEEMNIILNDNSKLDQLIKENLMLNSHKSVSYYEGTVKEEKVEEAENTYDVNSVKP